MMSCPTPKIELPDMVLDVLNNNSTNSRVKRAAEDPNKKYR